MQHVWVEPMAAPHRKTSLILRPGQQLNLKDVARLLGFDSEAPLRLQLANNTVSGIPMAGQATVRWSIEDLRTLTGRAGCETAPFLLQGLPMDAAKSQDAGTLPFPHSWATSAPDHTRPTSPPPPPPSSWGFPWRASRRATVNALHLDILSLASVFPCATRMLAPDLQGSDLVFHPCLSFRSQECPGGSHTLHGKD